MLIAVLSPDRASLPLAINSAGAPLHLHRAQARAGDGDGAPWVSTPRTWVMNEPRCYLNTRVLQQVTTAQITSPQPGTAALTRELSLLGAIPLISIEHTAGLGISVLTAVRIWP